MPFRVHPYPSRPNGQTHPGVLRQPIAVAVVAPREAALKKPQAVLGEVVPSQGQHRQRVADLDKPVARIPQALKPRRPRPEVPARGRSRAQSGSPTPEQTIEQPVDVAAALRISQSATLMRLALDWRAQKSARQPPARIATGQPGRDGSLEARRPRFPVRLGIKRFWSGTMRNQPRIEDRLAAGRHPNRRGSGRVSASVRTRVHAFWRPRLCVRV